MRSAGNSPGSGPYRVVKVRSRRCLPAFNWFVDLFAKMLAGSPDQPALESQWSYRAAALKTLA